MRVTRRFATIAATLVLAASSSPWGSHLLAQPNEESAVLQAVEALHKAMLDADRARLEELVADQLSYGHSGGTIQTKAQFVDAIVNKETIYRSIALTEPSTAIAGNNAIVRHMAAVDYESGGKAGSAKIGVLQVWIKQDGRWKLLARQAFKS
jgi:ketosteroid isomerase-like protein